MPLGEFLELYPVHKHLMQNFSSLHGTVQNQPDLQ